MRVRRDQFDAALKAKGLTGDMLAVEVGLHRSTLSRVRSGSRVATRTQRQAIAYALGVRVTDIFAPEQDPAQAAA